MVVRLHTRLPIMIQVLARCVRKIKHPSVLRPVPLKLGLSRTIRPYTEFPRGNTNFPGKFWDSEGRVFLLRLAILNPPPPSSLPQQMKTKLEQLGSILRVPSTTTLTIGNGR